MLAHLRRRFYELHLNGSSRLATQTVTTIAALWKIEGDIRGLAPAAPHGRPVSNGLPPLWPSCNLWEMELPRIWGSRSWPRPSAMPRPGAKFSNASSSTAALRSIPTSSSGRSRPQTITRKNALFAGSDGGGRTWATIATLLQTAKMNDVDPLTWLAQTLQRIANGWPISQIEKLMPWNYKT
jgi:transposase